MIRQLFTSSFAMTLAAAPASIAIAQGSTGSVVGVVRDSAGSRLDQARVGIVGAPNGAQRAESDSSGNYRISAVAVGVVRVYALRIGYAAETLSVAVIDGEPAHVDFIMTRSVSVLPEVLVSDDALRGKMGAFNRRKARGVGAFVTRADIEKRRPGSVSELLRYLPGVGVTQRMAGEPQPVHMQRSKNSSMQTCVVQIYVDGHPYPNGTVDDFSPGAVEGVEVYRSASEIPADFRTRNATCGLIALWTRDPDAARRRP